MRNKDYKIELIRENKSKEELTEKLLKLKLFQLGKSYLPQSQLDDLSRSLMGVDKPIIIEAGFTQETVAASEPQHLSRPLEIGKNHKRSYELTKIQGFEKEMKRLFECAFNVELEFFFIKSSERISEPVSELERFEQLLMQCLLGTLLMVLSDPHMIGDNQTIAFVERLTQCQDMISKGKKRCILVKKLLEESYAETEEFKKNLLEGFKLEVCYQESLSTGFLPTFTQLYSRVRGESKSIAELSARLMKLLYIKYLIPVSICVANDLPDEIEVSAVVLDHAEIFGKPPRCGLILLTEKNNINSLFGLLPMKTRIKQNFGHHGSVKKLDQDSQNVEKGKGDQSFGLVNGGFEKEQNPEKIAPYMKNQNDFTFNQDCIHTIGENRVRNDGNLAYGNRDPPSRSEVEMVSLERDLPRFGALFEPICLEPLTISCVFEEKYERKQPEVPTQAVQSTGNVIELIQKYTEQMNSILEDQKELESDASLRKMMWKYKKMEFLKKMDNFLQVAEIHSEKISLNLTIANNKKVSYAAVLGKDSSPISDFRSPPQFPYPAQNSSSLSSQMTPNFNPHQYSSSSNSQGSTFGEIRRTNLPTTSPASNLKTYYHQQPSPVYTAFQRTSNPQPQTDWTSKPISPVLNHLQSPPLTQYQHQPLRTLPTSFTPVSSSNNGGQYLQRTNSRVSLPHENLSQSNPGFIGSHNGSNRDLYQSNVSYIVPGQQSYVRR